MATLAHNYITDTNLPYITYDSPSERRPHYIAGQNVVSSARGFISRRNGFSAFGPATLTGTIERIFTWRKWSAGFYVMLSVRDGTQCKVYKYLNGTDTNFVLIFTSSVTTAFDFAVSNNYLYFGNGTDMEKY